MTVFGRVTDVVHGINVDSFPVTLEPVTIPSFVRVPVPPGLLVGDEVYVVLKMTVAAVIPS